MVEYLTNPEKRCLNCKGREVITLDKDKIPILYSLEYREREEAWFCKDKEECRQNVDAESTQISFGMDDEGVKEIEVFKNGRPVSQAISSNGKPLEDWFKW